MYFDTSSMQPATSCGHFSSASIIVLRWPLCRQGSKECTTACPPSSHYFDYYPGALSLHRFHLIAANFKMSYYQTSNISHTLVGNKIVDHSDVDGASPISILVILIFSTIFSTRASVATVLNTNPLNLQLFINIWPGYDLWPRPSIYHPMSLYPQNRDNKNLGDMRVGHEWGRSTTHYEWYHYHALTHPWVKNYLSWSECRHDCCKYLNCIHSNLNK